MKKLSMQVPDNRPNFVADLECLIGANKSVIPLILVKKNVCSLLESLLCRDGFKVKNKGQLIPFPIVWTRRKFRESMSAVIHQQVQ
jgi:hypothetical protein